MFRRFILVGTFALLAAPAMALTLEQAQAELAGMHCSGSSCTSSETVITVVQNPDIVTTTEIAFPETRDDSGQSYPHCTMGVIGKPGIRVPKPNVNADCVPQSISPTLGGGFRLVTTVTDGGTSIVETCATTTKKLTYNGPNTSRDGAWSVDTSVSTSDGAC